MVRELYGTSYIKYEDKEEILEYYVLNNNEGKIGENIETYGIEIVKRNEDSEEKSFVSDLSVNKRVVQGITQKIMEHLVTPIHLYDVLENFLS